MNIFSLSEKFMSMDDEVWARHANPWSVWSRFTVLPLFAAAIWSRVWLGWAALLPGSLVCFWAWYNPRAFSAPEDFGAWASRGVLGERIYLDRDNRKIEENHLQVAMALTLVSAVGIIPFVWGLWALDPWATIFGIALIAGGKTWFVDRMVWLHVSQTGIPLGSAMPHPVWRSKDDT